MCKRALVVVLLIATCVFYSPEPTKADFSENFTYGFDNLSAWDVDNPVGITFVPGLIRLSAKNGNTFPYVRSHSDVISPDDSTIEIAFAYQDTGSNFGDGIGITDENPPYGTVMSYPEAFSKYTMFYVWQGPTYPFLHVVTFLCSAENPECNRNPTIVYQTTSSDIAQHVLKISKNNSSYSIYFDSVKYFESSPTERVARNIWFGHPELTSSNGGWASLSLDYVKVTTISPPSPTPTVSPSPDPIPTPTPAPISFPYFSQKDMRWAKQIYDHATQWAAEGKRGIDRWGCALSSVAMILKKYGVKTLSGQEVTPATLNEWLRSQSDGYLRNGLINWLAISRYTHLSRRAGKSQTELEFSKAVFKSNDVDSLIAEGKYPILGIPGHFVLSYANNGTSYMINDPSNISHSSLGKNESILTRNVYSPSQTDLSYMLYAYDPQLTIRLTDDRGNVVDGITTEEYLRDDQEENKESNQLKLLYVPKPKTGDYELQITNLTNDVGKIDMYFYDQEGKVWTKKIGINRLTQTKFELKYDRNKVGKNKISHNWKWVYEYIKKWKRWERVWNWHNRWFERD